MRNPYDNVGFYLNKRILNTGYYPFFKTVGRNGYRQVKYEGEKISECVIIWL